MTISRSKEELQNVHFSSHSNFPENIQTSKNYYRDLQ